MYKIRRAINFAIENQLLFQIRLLDGVWRTIDGASPKTRRFYEKGIRMLGNDIQKPIKVSDIYGVEVRIDKGIADD